MIYKRLPFKISIPLSLIQGAIWVLICNNFNLSLNVFMLGFFASCIDDIIRFLIVERM